MVYTMSNGSFGELIRRKQPERKKIIIPPSRPPTRSPLNIKAKEYKRTQLPASSSFRKRADELRRKVVARDPSLARPPKGPPERSPLKIDVKPKTPVRSSFSINVKSRSHFEWVQAA